jgi:predicted nucleic-acid-binding protein
VKALDTDILVRFLVQDDQKQCARVNRLFEAAEQDKTVLYVPLLVTLELIWVLQSVYAVERKAILHALDALLQLPVLRFEQQPVVRSFISQATQSSGGLADLLIGESCKASGCESVLTFDKGASKNSLFVAL